MGWCPSARSPLATNEAIRSSSSTIKIAAMTAPQRAARARRPAASAIAIMVAPRFFAQTAGDNLKPEYPILILLSCTGMGMMVSAGDMLLLYVGLELQSLAAYVLASFMRRDTRSAEAGLKYFVLGALASGILLYGISLVYGFSGTTLFVDIAQAYAGGESSAAAVKARTIQSRSSSGACLQRR